MCKSYRYVLKVQSKNIENFGCFLISRFNVEGCVPLFFQNLRPLVYLASLYRVCQIHRKKNPNSPNRGEITNCSNNIKCRKSDPSLMEHTFFSFFQPADLIGYYKNFARDQMHFPLANLICIINFGAKEI